MFQKFVAVLATSFFAAGAWAGTQLHLEKESIDPTQVSTLLEKDRSSKNMIVQFQYRITEADKYELTKLGLKIINYIPDDALLVRSTNVVKASEVLNINGVRAVVPMLEEWKLSKDLPAASVFNANQDQSYLVKYFDGNYKYIHGTIADMNVLARDENVQHVADMPVFKSQVMSFSRDISADPAPASITGYETGTKIMKFQTAWTRGLTGSGEAVAMADTGLDYGKVGSLHQDFSSVQRGHKFGLFAKDWSDPMGHGTHVAGSVMSSGAASGGEFKGGAYGAEMIPQGMWSPVMKNLTVPPKLADMFEPAYKAGARVHTNSWGSPQNPGTYHPMSIQVDKYQWENPEMLVVFAAGNSGVDEDKDGRIDPGSVSFPGTAKNALTVGASENYLLQGGLQKKLGELRGGKSWGAEPIASDTLSNNENGVAAFSSRGPALDGRLKPDVVAPGTNIVSNCSQVPGASPLWGNYNDDYCYSGGTSMSTPLTAGGAAVVREYLKRTGMTNPSAAVVKAVLINGAVDMFPGQFGAVGKSRGQELLAKGPNNDQGYGRVDMDRSTDSSRFFEIKDVSDGVAAGMRQTFSFMAPDQGKGVKVTLVYTDAPGSENASKALVNDLDLKLKFAGQELISDSRVNNSEQIEISNVTGPFTVEVIGHNVPMGKSGKQPYALVISN